MFKRLLGTCLALTLPSFLDCQHLMMKYRFPSIRNQHFAASVLCNATHSSHNVAPKIEFSCLVLPLKCCLPTSKVLSATLNADHEIAGVHASKLCLLKAPNTHMLRGQHTDFQRVCMLSGHSSLQTPLHCPHHRSHYCRLNTSSGRLARRQLLAMKNPTTKHEGRTVLRKITHVLQQISLRIDHALREACGRSTDLMAIQHSQSENLVSLL